MKPLLVLTLAVALKFVLFFIQKLVWSITFTVFNPEKWFWTFYIARPSEKMNTDV